ncbi:unnamed protein product, partial [Pylaiella littoralis]
TFGQRESGHPCSAGGATPGTARPAARHAGEPAEPDRCRKCERAGRDPCHMHLTCAFQICLWCKLAGHRQPGCTNAFGPDV